MFSSVQFLFYNLYRLAIVLHYWPLLFHNEVRCRQVVYSNNSVSLVQALSNGPYMPQGNRHCQTYLQKIPGYNYRRLMDVQKDCYCPSAKTDCRSSYVLLSWMPNQMKSLHRNPTPDQNDK